MERNLWELLASRQCSQLLGLGKACCCATGLPSRPTEPYPCTQCAPCSQPALPFVSHGSTGRRALLAPQADRISMAASHENTQTWLKLCSASNGFKDRSNSKAADFLLWQDQILQSCSSCSTPSSAVLPPVAASRCVHHCKGCSVLTGKAPCRRQSTTSSLVSFLGASLCKWKIHCVNLGTGTRPTMGRAAM